MDAVILWLNFGACVGMAAASGYLVMSKRIHDGVIIKVGLILLSLGFGGHAWLFYDGLYLADVIAIGRAQLFIHLGLAVSVLGVVYRAMPHNGGVRHRRLTDYADLPTNGVSPQGGASEDQA